MSGDELMRKVNGETPARRQDREVVRRARQVHDEVRLRAFMVDGAYALAGHIMEGAVGLDAHRRALANGDQLTNTLLADIEQAALFSVKKIQTNLYNDFGL